METVHPPVSENTRRNTEWSKRPCCFAAPGGKYCPPIKEQEMSPCKDFVAKPNPFITL